MSCRGLTTEARFINGPPTVRAADGNDEQLEIPERRMAKGVDAAGNRHARRRVKDQRELLNVMVDGLFDDTGQDERDATTLHRAHGKGALQVLTK